MRTKTKIGVLFGAILLGLPTTGCHFPSFVPAELEKIAIEANPLKTFVAGDKFEECADFEIVGYYSDGSIKTLDKSDVDLIYVSKETGVGYNIDREIPFAGDYYLRARYKGCSEEERFEFSAVQDHIYINSISIKDCPTNSLVLGVGRPQLLYGAQRRLNDDRHPRCRQKRADRAGQTSHRTACRLHHLLHQKPSDRACRPRRIG